MEKHGKFLHRDVGGGEQPFHLQNNLPFNQFFGSNADGSGGYP